MIGTPYDFVAICENDIDREDGGVDRCPGRLHFKQGDLEAPCDTCGGRCGWMVATSVHAQAARELIAAPDTEFVHFGFAPEPELTGDGEGDPEKHIIIIALRDRNDPSDWEEWMVIVHRICGGKFPIDGELAQEKEVRAQVICDVLNGKMPVTNS